MDIRARHIIGTPEETANVGEIIQRETAKSLQQLDTEHASDWARANRRDSLTLGELYYELRGIIDAIPDHAHEGLSRMYTYDHATPARVRGDRPIPILTDTTKLGELRYRWIQVYPVTGSSEGHYIHVDLFWQKDYHEGRVPLFLLKTFGGHAEAVMLAGLLARVLGV
jgi:hypothetical protein